MFLYDEQKGRLYNLDHVGEISAVQTRGQVDLLGVGPNAPRVGVLNVADTVKTVKNIAQALEADWQVAKVDANGAISDSTGKRARIS